MGAQSRIQCPSKTYGGFLAGDGATASEVTIIMSIIPSDTYKHKKDTKRKKTKSTQSPTLVYQAQCTHVCSAPNSAVRTPQDLSQAMQSINPNMHGIYLIAQCRGLVYTEPCRSVTHHSPMPVYSAQCTYSMQH